VIRDYTYQQSNDQVIDGDAGTHWLRDTDPGVSSAERAWLSS